MNINDICNLSEHHYHFNFYQILAGLFVFFLFSIY